MEAAAAVRAGGVGLALRARFSRAEGWCGEQATLAVPPPPPAISAEKLRQQLAQKSSEAKLLRGRVEQVVSLSVCCGAAGI